MRLSYFIPLVFASLFFANILAAQTDLAIGQWKQHLPFNAGISVTQGDDKVFYGTQSALLVVDKADHALQKVTKVEGLSRVGVSLVKYNRQSKVLVIVYDNSEIDLLREDGIFNLPDIPGSNIVLGQKTIFDIYMANDSIAYLAANYGISTLNLKTGKFPNTVKTDVVTRAVLLFQNKLFAATMEGLYTIDPASGLNVDDFSNWTWLGQDAGFPADYSSKAMTIYQDKIFMDVNDSVYVYDGNTAAYFYHVDTQSVKYLTSEGAHLLAGFDCGDCKGEVKIFDENLNAKDAPFNCKDRPKYAVEDAQGDIWYADGFNAFRVQENGSGQCTLIEPNGPFSINVRDIEVNDGNVWVASGGVNLQFSGQTRKDGFFLRSKTDGQWSVFTPFREPKLKDLEDFFDILVSPVNGKVYTSSFLDGLVEYDPATSEFKVYNETNSTLGLAYNDNIRTKVAGLAFDQEGNLWMCNYNATKPLVVLKTDGTFQSFDLPCTNELAIFEIAIDAFGYKWLTASTSGSAIMVFDEGEFDDTSDDRCKVISTANSVLPNNEVSSMALDLDGAMWVGTKEGAVVFQCDPINGDCPGSRPFVEVDGFGANLLEDQDVRAIAVDGANRKWFGTPSGIFVQSPEGNVQVAKFTEENSPLFDNNITDIAFDHETGEVYIGTLKGIVSYRSDATGGQSFHQSEVLVFPNPVRPDYEGPIAIKGLATDSNVKITDVTGQLVFETTALGGQAIWYGRDYNDRKVNTGVYLVFATSKNSTNPDVVVGKILVVN